MNYNPYQYHYQGFQPQPSRPNGPTGASNNQQPYRSGGSAGSSRQTNYDMTWQHDMEEFERFLKDDKKTRKRSRSRSHSWDRNSGSFRSRSVDSDRKWHGSPRRRKGHQSPSPDRLSDLSTDSFYDTERLLRESNRLLKKGAESHLSVSPERKYGTGNFERDPYQRRSPDRERIPIRRTSPYGRWSTDRSHYQRNSHDRVQSPIRRLSPEGLQYQKSTQVRGRSSDRGQYQRRSIDRGLSPEGMRHQRSTLDRGRSPDRWRYHRNSPDRGYFPGRGQNPRDSPLRGHIHDREIYQKNDKGVESRSSIGQYPIKRSPSPVLDTLKELDRLEKELEISSRSRIEPSRLPQSANLSRGLTGAILREDKSLPSKELSREQTWRTRLGKSNVSSISGKINDKNQGKNNANKKGGNNNDKNKGTDNANQKSVINKNKENPKEIDVNQKGGNYNKNKNQGKKNNKYNKQSGENNSNQQREKNNTTQHRNSRSVSFERHVKGEAEKKMDGKKSDTRSRSSNASVDRNPCNNDKNQSPRRSHSSDKQRSNSSNSAKRKLSESRESEMTKHSVSSSKKLKVDDAGHEKTDKKLKKDDNNKKIKNDKDGSKNEKSETTTDNKDREKSNKNSEDKKTVEVKVKTEATKEKDHISDDKIKTSETDVTKRDREKQEIKEEKKVKSETDEEKENGMDEIENKNENKTGHSETKQSDISETSEKLENKVKESVTTSVILVDKNKEVKKSAVTEKIAGEHKTKMTETENGTESQTKKDMLIGYKIPKLPKPRTPEKTSPKNVQKSVRGSEKCENSDSDSDVSPYKSRKRSRSPLRSKNVHVHVIEGKTRKQILASSSAVVTSVKDSDPGAAERETCELLMKLLMKSQEAQEEQVKKGENIEKIASVDTEKGEEGVVIKEKTKENEVKPVVKEEPAKSFVGEKDEKSDRLAQLLKMSKEIEEEIKKLTGGTTSSDTTDKSESENKTEKEETNSLVDSKRGVDSKMGDNEINNEGSKNKSNETKQNESENGSDKKLTDSEDISAEDLDKVDLSSIQTKTLLSKLIKQSKMLEQQLELLSSSRTTKSEGQDDNIKTPGAIATVSKENVDKLSVETTEKASSSLEEMKKSESVANTLIKSNQAASKTVVSNTSSGSYSNSLQSLRKSTSSLVSKGPQSRTPVVQVSAVSSIKSVPIKGVQASSRKQNMSAQQTTVQKTPTANQEQSKQIATANHNTNKQVPMIGHQTGIQNTMMSGRMIPQTQQNVPRQPLIQSVRPNIIGNQPVTHINQPGLFTRPMVSTNVPPSAYFPTRHSVPGQSLTPLMSLPVAPTSQAIAGSFLSAQSSNPVSAPVINSSISVSNQPMIANQNNFYQPMKSGPTSNQPIVSGPASNQPMISGSNSMEMSKDLSSKFETVTPNQRHQSGRNLQNIVSIPEAKFTRPEKSKKFKNKRVTNSRSELTNTGMNKNLGIMGRNVFPDTGDQLQSSLLSNIKDNDQQSYIRSLWGDGGIGQSDRAGPSKFSGNVSLSSGIGFGDEKMAAGSIFGEGFGGGPFDQGSSELHCMNCGDIGHETGNCKEPKPPYADVQCRQCQQHGHKGRDCPLDIKNKKKLATNKPCYECREKGHLAKDCPWTRCFNCGGLGHKARDCNSVNIGEELEDIWCQFCGQDGHFDSSCPQKNRKSEASEEMLAKSFTENEIKRLKMYLSNMNNKKRMKSSPLDILMDACKYLNLGLRFKSETSVVTRVDNIELLSAALKMSGGVFLGRVFGYNRQILKARLYEKALDVLLSEPESLIIEEQDPGAHGYRITKEIYDDVCEKAAQDKECKKFLIRVATQPDTKDEFFIQKIEELRQENKISQYTVIAALRERHKLIYEKMNTASLDEILSNPDVASNATELFEIGKNPHEPWKMIDKFVIMENEDMCNVRKSQAFDILFYSAYRNGMLLQWWNRCIYTKAPNIYKCNIWLQNQPIGEAYTINKEEAKKLAAADALSNLYKRCPAIRIASAGSYKTKLWVMYREVCEKADALRMASMNNISPFERWIIQVCNEIILDYIKRPTLESLEFKQGFSEIEIAEIRTLSSSKGLNYQLRKDPSGMIVVIDKELHPMEILTILRQSGGVSGMYSVVSAFEGENIGKQMEIGNLLTVKDIDD